MTTTIATYARSRTASDVARPILPILIQVPTLTPSTRGRGRVRGSRRRLRKEVRFAGLTMMSFVPMGLLFLTLGGARPSDRPAVLASALAPSELGGPGLTFSPVIALTFEQGQGSTPTAAVPVMFPGYLLPVDGPEEPAHAGR